MTEEKNLKNLLNNKINPEQKNSPETSDTKTFISEENPSPEKTNPEVETSPLIKNLKDNFKEKILSIFLTKDNFLNIFIAKEDLFEVMKYLKENENFDFLDCISGVDLKDKLQLTYHLYAYKQKKMLVMKVNLTYENAQIKSLVSLYPTANWLEREIFDLFGICFLEHPDLRRILLPCNWVGYPLRKNYVKQTKDLCLREEIKPHLGGVKNVATPQIENTIPSKLTSGENA